MAGDRNIDKSTVQTTTVGTFYFQLLSLPKASTLPTADEASQALLRKQYICKQADITFAVNALPDASVYLSSGTGILNSGTVYDPEELLVYFTKEYAKSGNHRLAECAIYESATPGGFSSNCCVFKGYVISVQLSYNRSDRQSNRLIQIRLSGYGAQLMTSPFALYTNVAASRLADALSDAVDIRSYDDILAAGGNYQDDLEWSIDNLVGELAKRPEKTIVSKFSGIVAGIRERLSLKDITQWEAAIEDGDSDVEKALGGKTALKPVVPEEAMEGFDRDIVSQMLALSQNTDIFNAILRLVTSSDLVLQLVPRVYCDAPDDFKMEITPVTAWKPRENGILNISASDLSSIRLSYTAADVLNTPDIVAVDFREAFSFTWSNNAEGPGMVYGFASMNKDLNKSIQEIDTVDGLSELLYNKDGDAPFRITKFKAPKWLVTVAESPAYTENQGRTQADMEDSNSSIKPPSPECNNVSINDEPTPGTGTRPVLQCDKIRNQANILAQVLLYHTYMEDSTVSLSISPALRFGLRPGTWFENSLGDTVDVDLSEGTGIDSALHIKGALASIRLSYSTGQGTSLSYEIGLNRVRPAVADEEIDAVECPMYTVGEKHTKRT